MSGHSGVESEGNHLVGVFAGLEPQPVQSQHRELQVVGTYMEPKHHDA